MQLRLRSIALANTATGLFHALIITRTAGEAASQACDITVLWREGKSVRWGQDKECVLKLVMAEHGPNTE